MKILWFTNTPSLYKKKIIVYNGGGWIESFAGVRALQKNKRTLILAVDNRAIEIRKDVNLNVFQRDRVEEIQNFIENLYKLLRLIHQLKILIYKVPFKKVS